MNFTILARTIETHIMLKKKIVTIKIGFSIVLPWITLRIGFC
jgi:hypothetical protein